MKILENTKFTGAALLLLLALNSTLLVCIVMRRPPPPPPMMMPPPPPPGPNGEGPKNYLIRELNFSADQQTKFSAMVEKHHAKAMELQNEIHAMRDSMVHQLEKENADTVLINSLAEKIGADQILLEKNTFNHFLEVKSICNDEQKKKFSEIIGGALMMLAPPPGPRPPMPPGQNPPPPPQ